MKKYKAIFFDWDGTAVMSRTAPVDEAVAVMKPLLAQGVKLIIVSGTTIENIAEGSLGKYFTGQELENLYLGLGRGAYNYVFKNGKPHVFADRIPDRKLLSDIHRISFEIHMELKDKYDFDTDIVFSRPNYCKIDLMVNNHRGDQLFMQESELDLLKTSLAQHGIAGLHALIGLAVEVGNRYNVKVVPTCDAKYLEVGISSKSDNVNIIYQKLKEDLEITPEECSFWGDEYVGIEEGIFGSDSFMQTEVTKRGDFYDVSEVSGRRPEGVVNVKGGVNTFLKFLSEQSNTF